MIITLFTNTDDERVLEKNITQVDTYEGTLREGCNIQSPSITIQVPYTAIQGANYMYIPLFARYYYIDDMRIESNDMVTITARTDVLMSFKEDIRSQYAIVKKQAYKNNTWLNDGTFKIYQNRETVTKKFPFSFSGTTYVLMVSG